MYFLDSSYCYRFWWIRIIYLLPNRFKRIIFWFEFFLKVMVSKVAGTYFPRNLMMGMRFLSPPIYLYMIFLCSCRVVGSEFVQKYVGEVWFLYHLHLNAILTMLYLTLLSLFLFENYGFPIHNYWCYSYSVSKLWLVMMAIREKGSIRSQQRVVSFVDPEI